MIHQIECLYELLPVDLVDFFANCGCKCLRSLLKRYDQIDWLVENNQSKVCHPTNRIEEERVSKVIHTHKCL